MHTEAPLIPVVTCFLIGGVVSVISAGFLEYEVLRHLSVGALLGVGLTEEAVKLPGGAAAFTVGSGRFVGQCGDFVRRFPYCRNGEPGAVDPEMARSTADAPGRIDA